MGRIVREGGRGGWMHRAGIRVKVGEIMEGLRW